MAKISFAFLIFIICLVTELLVCCSGEEGNATFGCVFREMNALLRFKATLSDPSNRLSSWNATTDCCQWQGIMCHETSGHVIRLDLQNERYGDIYFPSSAYMLRSETLDSSLLDLKHLSFLDLSGNNFHLASIPSFLGSMNQIQHLNLSCSNFSGIVPHNLGNLSLLSVLDLSFNGKSNPSDFDHVVDTQLIVDDFMWVSRLSFLMHLNMSWVDLNQTNDLLKVLNMLPFLIDLRLSMSKLGNRNLQHVCENSTLGHIEYLDLSNNLFQGELPCFLENMTSLRYLLLGYNNYNSCDQIHLVKLTNLVQLSLHYNSLHCNADSISEFILDKPQLEYLSLYNNSCSGDVSKIILNLSGYPEPKLTSLILGNNHLYGQLPGEIGGIRKLKFLDLSYNNISGPVPTSIGNLSALVDLYLNYNQLNGEIPTSIGNLGDLEYLSLWHNQLNGEIPTSIGNLRALTFFTLSDNQLHGRIPESIGNLSELEYVYLHNNQLNGEIPTSIWNLSALEVLSLWGGQLTGEIPTSIRNLKALKILDLAINQLHGRIPTSIGNLSELYYLCLHRNQLNGEIPISLGQLSNLETVYLAGNLLDGTISESHLSNLTKLKRLWIGNNVIKFDVRSNWTAPFQLEYFYLQSCEIVDGEFPQWLQSQKELQTLYMSACSISGPLPNWLTYKNLTNFDLSDNSIVGAIPDSLCQMISLDTLDLSRNSLSGDLPDCWAMLNKLRLLSLSSNRLSGVVPNSIGRAYSLQWLQLSGNRFSGELPHNLKNCTQLKVLDVGENSISGELPKWIENYKLNLKVLRLSGNEFYGTISSHICQLSGLQILDLANNKLTGNLPHCFDNFTSMIFYNSTTESFAWNALQLMVKGTILEYFTTVRYVVYVDLSHNSLVGEIPVELTKLASLHFLNLSHNHLQGHIPQEMGEMMSLESLDLSNNNISGNIPRSLSGLNFLSRLNLSHNSLTGEIPTGYQLQTLEDTSIYEGNPGLCGAPLPKKCHEDKPSNVPNVENHVAEGEEDKSEKIWFYGVVISGFATGFWGVIGVLVFKTNWSYVYFKFVDGIIIVRNYDRINEEMKEESKKRKRETDTEQAIESKNSKPP